MTSQAAKALGKLGGKARWKGSKKEDRSALMSEVAKARWSKAKKSNNHKNDEL